MHAAETEHMRGPTANRGSSAIWRLHRPSCRICGVSGESRPCDSIVWDHTTRLRPNVEESGLPCLGGCVSRPVTARLRATRQDKGATVQVGPYALQSFFLRKEKSCDAPHAAGSGTARTTQDSPAADTIQQYRQLQKPQCRGHARGNSQRLPQRAAPAAGSSRVRALRST